MGYSTILLDSGSAYSSEVVNYVSGCLDPGDPVCQGTGRDEENPKFHFTVESWMGAQRRVAGFPVDVRPIQVKVLDFPLDDQYYLMPKVMESASRVSGCSLDQHICYNARWYEPRVHFDTWQKMVDLLGVGALQPCSTDPAFNPPMSNWFRSVTGDTGSMEQINGTSNVRITCQDDAVWFSPACRHNTSLCVPLMVQYYRDQAMQLAVFHNMPMAIVMTKAAFVDRFYEVVGRGRFLFEWYFPDDSLIDDKGGIPVMLNFPRTNLLEYSQNIFRTGLASFSPINYCWQRLPQVDPDVYYFLQQFNLYNDDMSKLMTRSRTLKNAGHNDLGAARNVACEWVRDNTARWRLWIPLKCDEGRYPTSARECDTCPAGSFCSGESNPVVCPAGHYCVAGSSAPTRCPVGKEQPGVGAASLAACTDCKPGYTKTEISLVSCLPCPAGFHCPPNSSSPLLCTPGTFSDEPGLLECKACAAGTAAKTNGQSSCPPCAAGQYQAATGQSSCEYCEVGTFAEAEGRSACAACPFAHAATASVGSQSVLDCGCQAGFYHECQVVRSGRLDNSTCAASNASSRLAAGGSDLVASFCRACPDDGTVCPGGLAGLVHAQPEAKPGYSLIPTEPYGSYQCANGDQTVCPGGPPGTCGAGRDGAQPGCGDCMAGHFKSLDVCEACAAPFKWYDVFVTVLVGLLWLLMFYGALRGGSLENEAFTDFVNTIAIVVRALSVVYIMAGGDSGLSGPSASLGAFLESILSQFSLIRPVCLVGSSFAARYFSKLVLYFLLIAVAVLGRHGKDTLFVSFRNRKAIAVMVNFLGLLMSGFYILITKGVVLIFECR
jgi:hypothetical protein